MTKHTWAYTAMIVSIAMGKKEVLILGLLG
jgi:hypothetical protein